MKRVALAMFVLLLVGAIMVPVVALAAEKATTTSTAALISYPKAQPDATAAEAMADTQWHKPGDLMNLVFAVLGLGGIFAFIVWGIIASRRVTAA